MYPTAEYLASPYSRPVNAICQALGESVLYLENLACVNFQQSGT